MRTLPLILAVMAMAAPALAVDAPKQETPIAFDVSFVSHVEAGVAEQDVYVTRGASRGKVYRPGPDDTDPDAPLFTAAEPQPHDPGNPAAVGPFKKGTKLDLTLGKWLGASGSGHYHVEDGEGHLTVAFKGLVPNGVYTLWHFFMANGETDPFIGTFDLPVGALDGSQSVFVADADGSATFKQSFDTALQLSGEQLTAGLAVNWHSDGKTYGVAPGAFGQNAHIQLFTALPQRPDL
ncbi:hypothetical protein [Denitrobaculum tricleocarpae]|uniref:Uncharacterized protein n=1 Tax=Denitrobaculum tricleocarpae TaxID=2591009 RepID=A0A545TN21_9PROT|nr:hypothetical protein [Denitrobaculum tricleocarpae]TQV78623.1 hypothetical protein FKG95_18925 [Denitrobaculum tricleocarpae]